MLASGFAEDLASLHAVLGSLEARDHTALCIADRLETMLSLEHARRRELALSNTIAISLAAEDRCALGDTPRKLIADTLRITPAEASRRLKDGALVAARNALTGEPLAAPLPAAAMAWHQGLLDPKHVAVIEKFFREIPAATQQDLKDWAEEFLADYAVQLRPDQLTQLAQHLAITVNPDGVFTDEDRVRKSGLTWSAQRSDGMSKATLWANPELRAALDAWFAKFAQKGMCMPGDDGPSLFTPSDPEATAADVRTPPQRRHDALLALLTAMLGNPALGTHHGLPVSIVASAKLSELEKAAGWSRTMTGTLIPITTLIRMANRGANSYLVVFDNMKEIPLYLGKAAPRLATAGQRLALFAKEGGCSFPDCDQPADRCDIHHHNPFAVHRRTDITDLTHGCFGHHPLAGPGGWTNSVDENGVVHWHPPAHYPRKTKTSNYFWNAERFLAEYRAREEGDRNDDDVGDPRDDDVGAENAPDDGTPSDGTDAA